MLTRRNEKNSNKKLRKGMKELDNQRKGEEKVKG